MAVRAFLLALVAALCVSAYAQSCVSLGGSLISSCATELEELQSIYPLDSSELPTEQQLSDVTATAASLSLPTAGCCTAAQTFDAATCQCDSSLPSILGTLGLSSSSTGIVGYLNLTRSLCGYTGTDC